MGGGQTSIYQIVFTGQIMAVVPSPNKIVYSITQMTSLAKNDDSTINENIQLTSSIHSVSIKAAPIFKTVIHIMR